MATNELQLITELVSEFTANQDGLDDNTSYYEASHRPTAIGVTTPPQMRQLLAAVGWPRVYVNSIEERLDIEGFQMAGAASGDEELWSWWQTNQLDELSSFAHTEALIHGRSYIIVSAPDPDDPLQDQNTPVIEVESPKRVWADINPRNGRVRYAIRVVRSQTSALGAVPPDYVTIYTPNETVGYEQGGKDGWVEDFRAEHNLGIVPVVPLLNRARLSEINGQSEITTELRSCTDAAARTMMNMQATAELMAVPQRLLFGVKPEELTDDPKDSRKVFEAYVARILAFEDPEGKAQQFSAAELRNFTEVLDHLAKQAATYTGLPPQYLSFTSENPASADAIRAAESRLVKKAERKQRIFGAAWEQAMRIAMRIMGREVGVNAMRMETIWRDASTPTFAAKVDGVVKLATAATPEGRPVLPVEGARMELGYSEETRKQFEKWERQSPRGRLADLYGPQDLPAAPPEQAVAA